MRLSARMQIARLTAVNPSRNTKDGGSGTGTRYEKVQPQTTIFWSSQSDAARARATVGEISDAMEFRIRPLSSRNFVPCPASMAAPMRATMICRPSRRDRDFLRGTRAGGREFSSRRWDRMAMTAGREDHRHRVRGPGIRCRIRSAVPDTGRVAKDAIEADVHVIGVSSQAAGHMTLVPTTYRFA